MCGLVGIFNVQNPLDSESSFQTLEQMTSTLQHRGPDDRGKWLDSEAGIAFGFQRLAILDLSPFGHQPMHSACGRYAMVFNGEIYNFVELRQTLEHAKHRFQGHSDSEVLLAAFANWGVEQTLQQINGMFAIALWDKQEKILHLMRDRLGKKPLYYSWCGESFLFGSELKALRVHPDFKPEIDRSSLELFLRLSYIPSPHCIYRNTWKLPPGHRLEIKAGQTTRPKSVAYWSMSDAATKGLNNLLLDEPNKILDSLDGLLRDAVQLRMVADVPLGALLSGGVDSSLVVALMQAQSSRPVETFSIGFADAEYDESPYAAAMAKHLGTNHHFLQVTPTQARDVIPVLPKYYDEPFADSSQIPTVLVSRLARRHVTVALSGDGGDELFGGYGRYELARRLRKGWRWLHPFLRRPSGYAMRGASSMLKLMPQRRGRRSGISDRLRRLATIATSQTEGDLYLNAGWEDHQIEVIGDTRPPTATADDFEDAPLDDFVQKMMYTDTVNFLPDDILVKVDRASMSDSLEARAPLLDYRLAELAWRIPVEVQYYDGAGKWPLRELLCRYAPRELVKRPKMGFDVPIGDWLRGPLRDWAEALLDPDRLRSEGFLEPQSIRRIWSEHLNGLNRQSTLWNVLMFQAWLEHTHDSGA